MQHIRVGDVAESAMAGKEGRPPVSIEHTFFLLVIFYFPDSRIPTTYQLNVRETVDPATEGKSALIPMGRLLIEDIS